MIFSLFWANSSIPFRKPDLHQGRPRRKPRFSASILPKPGILMATHTIQARFLHSLSINEYMLSRIDSIHQQSNFPSPIVPPFPSCTYSTILRAPNAIFKHGWPVWTGKGGQKRSSFILLWRYHKPVSTVRLCLPLSYKRGDAPHLFSPFVFLFYPGSR